MATLYGLTACSPQTSAVPAPVAGGPDAVATGARLYAGNCVACHQEDAHGLKGVYPSLVGSPVILGDPASLALWVIKGRRPASLPEGRYSTMMPQFGWMKAPDAAALFTYLRSHYGNSAPSVDAATVAGVLGQ